MSNRQYWLNAAGNSVAEANELCSVAPMLASTPTTSLTAPMCDVRAPIPYPSATAIPTMTHTSATDNQRVARLRQWQLHTAWPAAAEQAAQILDTQAPLTAAQGRPPTPLYGDTSSGSSETPHNRSTDSDSYSYTYAYSAYPSEESDTRTARTVSLDDAETRAAPPPRTMSPLEHNVRLAEAERLRPPVPFSTMTEGNQSTNVVLAIAPSMQRTRAARGGDEESVTACRETVECASQRAAVDGFPVARPSGIQVLSFRKTSVAKPDKVDPIDALSGMEVLSSSAAARAPGLDPLATTTSLPTKRHSAVPLSAVCLGRLPGAADAAVNEPPSWATTRNDGAVSCEDGGDQYASGNAASRSAATGWRLPSSPSSSSSSCSAPVRRRPPVLGEDPLAYQPPRVPRTYSSARGAEATVQCPCACHAAGDAASLSSPASTSSCASRSISQGTCTCCSACASDRATSSCCTGLCAGCPHTTWDAPASLRADSDLVLVSHEAHRQHAARDPFSRLGPAAPTLLRLGIPRQTAAHGTLPTPTRAVDPPKLPTIPTACDEGEADQKPLDARPPQPPHPVHKDAQTQVETTPSTTTSHSIATQVEASARPMCGDAEDWRALLDAQTHTLRAEWQSWTASVGQEEAMRRRAAEEAAAAVAAQRERQEEARQPAEERGCSPHETAEDTALAFVRAAARDDGAQELHEILAELYHDTPAAREDAALRRTELSAAVERERQTAEKAQELVQTMQNLLLEQLVSLEVEEAEQRLHLLDLEGSTRHSVLEPLCACVGAVYATCQVQLEASRHRFTQQLLSEVLKRQLEREVMSAEETSRQALEMTEQSERFTRLTPQFHVAHQTLALAEATTRIAELSVEVTRRTREQVALEHAFRQLQQQDAERRVALAEALRRPTVTLGERSSSVAHGEHGPGATDDGERDDDIPIHRRFARAHQEALKVVRAQQRRV